MRKGVFFSIKVSHGTAINVSGRKPEDPVSHPGESKDDVFCLVYIVLNCFSEVFRCVSNSIIEANRLAVRQVDFSIWY